MIDVQVRISLSAFVHKIHETLEDGFLAFSVKGPVGHVVPGTALVSEDVAEQIFEAVLANESIAFDIEVDVPLGRFRQQAQADILNDRQ